MSVDANRFINCTTSGTSKSELEYVKLNPAFVKALKYAFPILLGWVATYKFELSARTWYLISLRTNDVAGPSTSVRYCTLRSSKRIWTALNFWLSNSFSDAIRATLRISGCKSIYLSAISYSDTLNLNPFHMEYFAKKMTSCLTSPKSLIKDSVVSCLNEPFRSRSTRSQLCPYLFSFVSTNLRKIQLLRPSTETPVSRRFLSNTSNGSIVRR
mmetsp:Transcript_20343/g.33550  ORF Transcript_20343/g.33550 Transcript_20343/m.33550 type:complete len:213 (-) Transcript_20343:402-1040(-)